MSENGKDQESVQVPLVWGSDRNLDTIYANHLFISHAGGEFYLIFGEVILPPYIKENQIPENIEIAPKARIAVAPKAMKLFVEAMQSNLEKYNTKEDE